MKRVNHCLPIHVKILLTNIFIVFIKLRKGGLKNIIKGGYLSNMGRLVEVLKNCNTDCLMLNDEIVSLHISRHLFPFISRFIVVWLVIHHGLDGDQEAAEGHGGALGGPGPGTEDGKADHAVLVEIRIESDSAITGGHQLYFRC